MFNFLSCFTLYLCFSAANSVLLFSVLLSFPSCLLASCFSSCFLFCVCLFLRFYCFLCLPLFYFNVLRCFLIYPFILIFFIFLLHLFAVLCPIFVIFFRFLVFWSAFIFLQSICHFDVFFILFLCFCFTYVLILFLFFCFLLLLCFFFLLDGFYFIFAYVSTLWLQRESNPQPLSSKTNTQLFS